MSQQLAGRRREDASPKETSRPKSEDIPRWKALGLQLVALAALFGSWELISRRGWINPAYISQPTLLTKALWTDLLHGDLVNRMFVTLYETLAGFSISLVLGLAVGLVLAEFKLVEVIARPFMTGFNNIPRIALAPLFVLWFGLGSLSRIVLVVSLCFFIIAFNTYAGLQSANGDHLRLARMLGASRLARFTKFTVPAALPTIFTGIQLALTYAFMAAVVGEMLSGSQGLGGYLALTLNTFNTDQFFGGLLLLIIVSLACSGLVNVVQARLLRWKAVEMHGTRS